MTVIREARKEDQNAIEEIGRLTWEGHDYLPRVFRRWLFDGNFFVVEEDGKAVATAKLTKLPCGVGWMEGLRVHPSYRGRGLARKLQEHLISLGKRMASRGELETLMYATYTKNEASIHLGLSTGFRIVKRFHHMLREPEASDADLRRVSLIVPSIGLIPVGWVFVRGCDETVKWLKDHVEAYEVGETGFFLPKERGSIFTPFDYERLKEALPGMMKIASKRRKERMSIMVPEDMPHVVEMLRSMGFSQWELKEPDVLVLELKLKLEG